MVKLIVHAPTPAALVRARRNVVNLLAADSEAEIELVVNGEAAAAALGSPDPATDGHLLLCANSLASAGLHPPEGIRTVDAAILYIAQCQADGWSYFRA